MIHICKLSDLQKNSRPEKHTLFRTAVSSIDIDNRHSLAGLSQHQFNVFFNAATHTLRHEFPPADKLIPADDGRINAAVFPEIFI